MKRLWNQFENYKIKYLLYHVINWYLSGADKVFIPGGGDFSKSYDHGGVFFIQRVRIASLTLFFCVCVHLRQF